MLFRFVCRELLQFIINRFDQGRSGQLDGTVLRGEHPDHVHGRWWLWSMERTGAQGTNLEYTVIYLFMVIIVYILIALPMVRARHFARRPWTVTEVMRGLSCSEVRP